MGIRGLTTFIQSRSHLYMDTFELHHTNIVIDGNAIACQLYRWHCPDANDCFGGDYDRYAKVVQDFFQLLFDCHIVPYVIFDGGYENKKVATVISRMKNKIATAAALDSVSEGSYSVFPLFLRDCFEEILNKLKVKRVRCDFEGDSEIANVARILNCPLLSYDSDFFIFDVLYIPFKTMELKSRVKKVSETKECYKYISCQVYRIDKFLNSYGGMDKSNLPILAVLLGNDYVRRSTFSVFFQNLKVQKCQKNMNEQQRRIKSLIVWLQNETKESAVRKVISRYKKCNRQKVFDKIQNAIQGYYCSKSKCLEYFNIEQKLEIIPEYNIQEDNISDEEVDSDTEMSDSSEEIIITNTNDLKFSTTFLNKFRQCIYPPCFMDIVRHTYYCIPQVENISLEHSHSISSDILSAIHKILTNSTNDLICMTRIQNTQVGKINILSTEKEMPNLDEIETLLYNERIKVILKVLEIDIDYETILSNSPKSWALFILTIKFFTIKLGVFWPLIHSLVLCKVVLEFIDNKVQYCRNRKKFEKKYSSILRSSDKKNTEEELSRNIDIAINNISYLDCLHALNILLHYFDMDEKLKTHRKSFDRNLVHNISQFQSCLLLIKYLNCLLNFPFSDILISNTLNCTFVYNLTINLKKRSDCDNYLKVLLDKSPSVHNVVKIIINELKGCCQNFTVAQHVSKRKKKKRLNKSTNDQIEDYEEDCDNQILYDPNNKFSLLAM